jgi:hypothetical protein
MPLSARRGQYGFGYTCVFSKIAHKPLLGKILVVVIFLAIVGSLVSAAVFLVAGRGQSEKTAKALTLRVGVSIFLFVLLFILWWLGVITPHGIQQ